eukprot:COSAG03_NODE_477_length_7595_cov_112.440902_2_plen_57_part_00
MPPYVPPNELGESSCSEYNIDIYVNVQMDVCMMIYIQIMHMCYAEKAPGALRARPS